MGEQRFENPQRVEKTGEVRAATETPWGSDDHEPATVIVLAGGRSTRMGVDKRLLLLDGEPMIQHIHRQVAPHFDELLIAGGADGQLAFLNARVVPDEVPGQGPLQGIASALAVSRHDLNFVIACDIPLVNLALLGALLREANDCDCAVPVTPDGRCEPLFAVYRKSALPAMRRALQAGERRVVAAFQYCRVKTVPLASPDEIKNINTLDDYREFLSAR
ncbi:MAG TPA: molybdenum cofactor guanylyltransferase [Candidatus Hydrogenedentes bacterium]|nr:molybdenum cofactor guanylyltransferase [Candidatus Hydrogenedentota bacterium]